MQTRLLTPRELFKLAADAIRESSCNAFIDDVDTMRQDSEAVVQRDGCPIALGESRYTLPSRHVPEDGGVVGWQTIHGEDSIGWLIRCLLIRTQGLVSQ
jgi:hypothetical protein